MKEDALEIDIKPKQGDDDDDDDDDYMLDDDDFHDNRNRSVRNRPHKVSKKSGSIDFKTDQHYGRGAKICVNVKKNLNQRKTYQPVYVSLQVIETGDVMKKDFFDDDYMAELDKNIKKEEEESKDMSRVKAEETENQKEGHAHMNYVEKTIFNMLREISFLQNNVEAHKKTDARFFQKSKDMHLSSKLWPIIHLVVFIVTGFLQARHMMSFFKSRRVM